MHVEGELVRLADSGHTPLGFATRCPACYRTVLLRFCTQCCLRCTATLQDCTTYALHTVQTISPMFLHVRTVRVRTEHRLRIYTQNSVNIVCVRNNYKT